MVLSQPYIPVTGMGLLAKVLLYRNLLFTAESELNIYIYIFTKLTDKLLFVLIVLLLLFTGFGLPS